MTCHAPRLALIVAAASLSACPDDPTTTEVGSTGGSSTSDASSSTDAPTSSTTDQVPTTTADTGDTTEAGSSTGAVIDPCAFQCGALAMCCPTGDACVDNACAPACASDVRCGENLELCCQDGEVCSGLTCAAPGGACAVHGECAPGEYCDPAAQACLPVPDPQQCAYSPDTTAVASLWSFEDDEVLAMPVVVDVDGDGVSEVFVNTTRATGDPNDTTSGELISLDGATGALRWRIPHDPANDQYGALGRATIAAGDVSGDGVPDIVYAGRYADAMAATSTIHAVDGDGNFLWTARNPDDSDVELRISNGAATLVNLDADPMAEVAFGAAIFDHDGLLVWNQNNAGGVVGSPHSKNMPNQLLYSGGIATFADLTGDGYPELVTGREAWTIDWQAGDPPDVTLTQLWQNTDGWGGDGWPSVADLDQNGTPEVVLVAWPEIKVLDGATGELWCGVDPTGVMCQNDPALRTQPLEALGNYLGGPAAIADFDGDGRPEFALTRGNAFSVFDLNRMGETIVVPNGDPQPMPGAIYVRWQQGVQDQSSAATAALAFDYNADGAADVLYQDECYLRVFHGATGDIALILRNSTATVHEYPVLADIDGDGSTELLSVANQSDPAANDDCLANDPDWTPRQGVFLYRAAADNWAATRAAWTQHTSHVTNADTAGNVPTMEMNNWDDPTLNNFRAALQGEAPPPNAPDLSVTLSIAFEQCPDTLVLQAHVINLGDKGVPAGVPVAFFDGPDIFSPVIDTVPTSEALVPGGSTIVELAVPAPPAKAPYAVLVDPDDTLVECNEINNSALVLEAACP